MRLAHVLTLLLFPFLCFPVFAEEKTCRDIMGESPTSSAARICAANDLMSQESALKELELKLENVLSGDTGLGLKKEAIQRAQNAWRNYRATTCWLEAAVVGEPTATQTMCEARMTSCRITSLTKLLSAVTEGGYFSANEPCQ
ncbi:MAG: DUF1311 domain-containing protein [Rhodocyclaceae bacterium]|nr:DUF1311 domain-containing protein [Rhodocyclaceae bacterium]